MDSLDIGHVNPNPRPEDLTPFKLGEKTVVVMGRLWMMLRITQPGSAYFTLNIDGQFASDWLNLDKPCVAFRLKDGQPAVTLTARYISPSEVLVQISAHPALTELSRAAYGI